MCKEKKRRKLCINKNCWTSFYSKKNEKKCFLIFIFRISLIVIILNAIFFFLHHLIRDTWIFISETYAQDSDARKCARMTRIRFKMFHDDMWTLAFLIFHNLLILKLNICSQSLWWKILNIQLRLSNARRLQEKREVGVWVMNWDSFHSKLENQTQF